MQHNNRFPHSLILYSLLIASFITVPGCGTDDPMKLRMEEFRYTTEQLAEELSPRLEATKGSARSEFNSPDAASQLMAEVEAIRGGDGDRPDPNSLQAIVIDTVIKVRGIAGPGGVDATVDELLNALEGKPDLDKDVLKDFSEQLREKLRSP